MHVSDFSLQYSWRNSKKSIIWTMWEEELAEQCQPLYTRCQQFIFIPPLKNGIFWQFFFRTPLALGYKRWIYNETSWNWLTALTLKKLVMSSLPRGCHFRKEPQKRGGNEHNYYSTKCNTRIFCKIQKVMKLFSPLQLPYFLWEYSKYVSVQYYCIDMKHWTLQIWWLFGIHY